MEFERGSDLNPLRCRSESFVSPAPILKDPTMLIRDDNATSFNLRLQGFHDIRLLVSCCRAKMTA
jgi:hypothetical protein